MTSTTQAAPPGNEVFLRNMRLLWRFDAELALRLDAIHDNERLQTETARSGPFTVRAPTENGQTIYLHSRHDPLAEAKNWADAVPVEEKYCVVVSGFGLGYHLQALFKRLRGEAFIICIEPNLPMLATAVACNDLTELLESKRLVILHSDDKARLHLALQPFASLIMLGAQFAPYAPCLRLGRESYVQIQAAIAEYVTFTRMSLLTLVGNARITCKNIAMNLLHYVTTPPIEVLKDRFAGQPAIIISAGPSLSKNIDQLVDLKGRAVLIAVQTAVRPLMRKGIVPDFITSLDFHEMSRKFFEDVGDLSGAHLVAEPKATWHVIDNFPGPISLLDNAWARLVLRDELVARGGLPAGATVAHLAFYLAAHLGCDPIIFVGQDLAFSGHVFYVPGVEIHQSWRGELNRFNTMEMKEWDRIVRNRPILRKVRGCDGSELYTDELLFTYLEQFEKDIAATPRRVINATEGGARIRGTQSMSLREAARKVCSGQIVNCQLPIANSRSEMGNSKSTIANRKSTIERAAKEVQARIDELHEAEKVCDELLTLLRELDGLTHDPPRFNRRLIRVDELRAKIHADTRAYQIINMATQLAELRRFSADRRLEAAEVADAERAKRQIARDIDFITAVRDGAKDVIAILGEALERMRHTLECDAGRLT